MTMKKQKKAISVSFHAHCLKILKKTLRKKPSKEKEDPVKGLCLYSRELKPWKNLDFRTVQDCKNLPHKNCYSCNYQQKH